MTVTYRQYNQHVQDDFRNFVPKNLELLKAVPLFLKIGGSTFSVPRILDKIPTGAYYDADDIAKGMKDDKSTALLSPLFCAVFLQPGIDKEYDYDRAVELAEVLRDDQAWKVCSLTPFFLTASIALRSGTMNGVQLWLTVQRNWRQEQRRLRRASASPLPSIHFPDIRDLKRTN